MIHLLHQNGSINSTYHLQLKSQQLHPSKFGLIIKNFEDLQRCRVTFQKDNIKCRYYAILSTSNLEFPDANWNLDDVSNAA
jgi:hypothetical protein